MHGDADELDVRTARPDDAAAIARVYVKTWKVAYQGLLPPAVLEKLDVRVLTTTWKKIIQTDLVLVASLGTDVVAFVSAGREETHDPFFLSEVRTLYVLPEQQRRGIGSGLLFETLQLIELPALIWVLEENHEGRAFYESCGALPVRRRVEHMSGAPVPQVGYAFFDPG